MDDNDRIANDELRRTLTEAGRQIPADVQERAQEIEQKEKEEKL